MTQTTRSQPRDFGFGDDEALVRDQARKFLAEHATTASVRRLVAADHDATYVRGELPAFDREAWKKCVELGWTSLAVPEVAGGIGAKAVAVTALVEEVGRRAFPCPLIATLIATYVLRQATSEAAHSWLGKVAEGSTFALAITNADGDWSLAATEVRAQQSDAGFVLDGTAHYVQDAFKVDGFLVAARAAGGLLLAVVPRAAEGVTLARDHIVDLTRDQARVTLAGVSIAASELVAVPGEGLRALELAWPAVLTLVAADLVGCSEWQLQTTVEYAKIRKQFDHAIGFFQAVKHPLVNAMMAIDRARSLLYNAACAVDCEPDEAEVAARMAKSAASDAAAFVSGRTVQLHGGIGFTWESDVHLFFKRNLHNQALYGDAVHQRRQLANLLIGAIPTPA